MDTLLLREDTGAETELHFFTSWITSSSSITWSLPTFCGLCLTDEPQTRALEEEEENEQWQEKKKTSGSCCLKFTKTHNYSVAVQMQT